MSAIITDDFKHKIIDDLYTDIDSADSDSGNYYYIGLGRTTPWDSSDTPEIPLNTVGYVNAVRDNMQSVKRVTDYSRVVKRFNWTAGAIYSPFSNGEFSFINPYYIVTDENKVYICVQQGKDGNGNAIISSIQPSETDPNSIEVTADGYAWKFMYNIGSLPASKYLSANFFPVTLHDSDTAIETYEIEQLAVQNAAEPGQVIGVEVINGGSDYTTATVTIEGDGSGAACTATINNGSITKIEMDETLGDFDFGSGYTRAIVNISGDGTGATGRAILSIGGLGANPIIDLGGTAIMYTTAIDGTQDDDFIVDNDFRQAVLFKNPLKPNTDSDFTDNSGIVLKRLEVEAGWSSQPSIDDVIEGATSATKGIVNYFDESNRIIWYNQDSSTGYGDFIAGEQFVGYVMNIEVGSPFIDPDINNNSGEILYIDNRNPVTRADDQIDDIKLVIKV